MADPRRLYDAKDMEGAILYAKQLASSEDAYPLLIDSNGYLLMNMTVGTISISNTSSTINNAVVNPVNVSLTNTAVTVAGQVSLNTTAVTASLSSTLVTVAPQAGVDFNNDSVGASGSATPASATQVGGFDTSANLRAFRVIDTDSGAGSEYHLGVNLRKIASGGSVEAGTASDPFVTSLNSTVVTSHISPSASVVTVHISPSASVVTVKSAVAGFNVNVATATLGTVTVALSSTVVTVKSEVAGFNVNVATATLGTVTTSLSSTIVTAQISATSSVVTAHLSPTTTRVSVTMITGQTAVDGNVGAVSAATQRFVVANDTGRTMTGATGTISATWTSIFTPTNKAKVYAFSFTTTSASEVTVIVADGVFANSKEQWRCTLMAPAGASAGANLAVQTPGYLFSSRSASAITISLSTAALVHYTLRFFDEA